MFDLRPKMFSEEALQINSTHRPRPSLERTMLEMQSAGCQIGQAGASCRFEASHQTRYGALPAESKTNWSWCWRRRCSPSNATRAQRFRTNVERTIHGKHRRTVEITASNPSHQQRRVHQQYQRQGGKCNRAVDSFVSRR